MEKSVPAVAFTLALGEREYVRGGYGGLLTDSGDCSTARRRAARESAYGDGRAVSFSLKALPR